MKVIVKYKHFNFIKWCMQNFAIPKSCFCRYSHSLWQVNTSNRRISN